MVCKYNNDILKKRKKTEINYKKMIVHVHTKGFTTTFSAYFIVFYRNHTIDVLQSRFCIFFLWIPVSAVFNSFYISFIIK